MNIFEQIKQIPIISVLDKCGIQHKKVMWTLQLYDNWKYTDWWRGNINDNFITDFSWKRACWDQLAFVEKHLRITRWEAVDWFKRNFDIRDEEKIQSLPMIDVKSVFLGYNKLWEKQISYLQTRWIDYEKVKDVVKENNWWISCMLHNEKWKPISINTRSIDKKEFRILSWTQSKGVYMWDIDINNKKVYVVEWMFDFLTLRQYTKNVIWLKSINDWIDVVREFFIKWYEIVLIPDNDEVWKTLLDRLKDIKYSYFDLWIYEEKDINDFMVKWWYAEAIFEIIDIDKKKWWYQEEFEIVNYEETLLEWIDELYQTDPKTAIKWGFEELDNKLWYIFPWQLILVWGTTGTWKSTFVWEIAKNISRQWNKVLKFTLEDRLQDRKKQDLYVCVNKNRKMNWLTPYPYNEFMSNNIKNTLVKKEIETAKVNLIEENRNIKEIRRQNEKQIDIWTLEMIVKKWIEMWCKTIVLDHLQEFKVEWDKERQDLRIEEMMYKIKNIARKYKITIILIAHFKKVEWKPSENSFKDSISVAQVPNKVLLLHRDKLEPDSLTDLIIVKNREKPDWTWTIQMNFDITEMKYTNAPSNLKNNPYQYEKVS